MCGHRACHQNGPPRIKFIAKSTLCSQGENDEPTFKGSLFLEGTLNGTKNVRNNTRKEWGSSAVRRAAQYSRIPTRLMGNGSPCSGLFGGNYDSRRSWMEAALPLQLRRRADSHRQCHQDDAGG